MMHRKTDHLSMVAQCRKNLIGKCTFSGELCWWNHNEEEKNLNVECYFCENNFENRGKVMMHRKKEHPRTVRPCTKFLDSECNFGDETCWFKHEGRDAQNKETPECSNQDFQEVTNPP